ncbi:MAG: hypothetical protein KDC53_16465 [Saprospiraceae bacterium]|nr:hypothetical protein [Saprospiraceae bacterium]
MRICITLVALFFFYSGYSQNSAKWDFNFNFQSDAYLRATQPTEAFGKSSFRGWSANLERTLFAKKYLKLSGGLGLSYKKQVLTGDRYANPFSNVFQKGRGIYYLTAPFTLTYTRSSVIQPSLTVSPGFAIINNIKNDRLGIFHRPPTTNFLSIMPGVNLRISDRINVFAGISLNNYDLFSKGSNRWATGFQIGIKVNLRHRKK